MRKVKVYDASKQTAPNLNESGAVLKLLCYWISQ